MAKRQPADALSRHLAANVVAVRRMRNLSQAQVAELAGIPRSTISHVESGQANPSLSTLTGLAAALSVGLDELVSPPRALVHRVPASEVPVETRSGGRARLGKLLPERVRGLEIDRLKLAPGATMRGMPHLTGTKEYLHVLAGHVQVLLAGVFHDVYTGDVLAFAGDQSHAYRNPEREEADAISVVVPLVRERKSG